MMIDKNLNWQSHIKLVERKISKNIGALFKGSLHLSISTLTTLATLTTLEHQISTLQVPTFMQKAKYTTIP